MKPKIVIQILGGCLSCVHASEEMDVELIDHDNQSEEEDFDSEKYSEEQTKGLIEIF